MYLLLALVTFPLILADSGQVVFRSTLQQFATDRKEFLSQGLGRLTDGRSKRETPRNNVPIFTKRSVAAIKANTIRLIRPDDVLFNNGTGRVEVFHNAQWGTVCDRDWDFDDAQVACSELGMIKAIHESRKAKYGEGVGPIWLSGMQCRGSEMSLLRCKHEGWGEVGDCTHKDDAGVRCLHTGLPVLIEIGCFKDKPKPDRSLRHLIANLRSEIDWYNIRSMVTKCAERTHEKGFKYFGVQFYGECWADEEGEARHQMYGSADPADKSQKCFEGVGMHYANFVYRFAPWRDLGCWRDVAAERAMPRLLVNLRYKIDWLKIEKTVYDCSQAAKQAGYQYFSVQFYGECWVSKEDNVYRKHGPSTNCWNGVGGQITNYVYQLVE